MKCAKCGLELLPGTKQCPKCGCINEFVETSAPAPKRRRSPVIYATIAFAVVGVLALVFYAIASKGRVTQVSSGDKPIDTNITAATSGSPNNGGLTNAAPGTPGNGGPSTPGNVKPKPPKEVVDYLEHVKKVEEHRQMLLKDQDEALQIAVQGVVGLFVDSANTGDDPWAPVKTELNRQSSNWQNTLKYFDAKPAPPECRAFSGSYRSVLQRPTEAATKVSSNLNQLDFSKTHDATKMYDALNSMLSNVQAPINASEDDANKELDNLVSQYDMQKPFEIYREKNTGNILTP